MKKYILILFVFVFNYGFSQVVDTIHVPTDKTAKLIFSDSIAYYDIGTELFDVKKKGNRFLIFSPSDQGKYHTSLFIELVSGHYYEFVLVYDNHPKKTIYTYSHEQALGINKVSRTKIVETHHNSNDEHKHEVVNVVKKENPKSENVKTEKVQKSDKVEEKPKSSYQSNADIILKKSDSFSGIGELKNKTFFWLNNLYVVDDKIYMKVTIKNQSNLNYNINNFRFSISNKKPATKNSTVADDEVKAVFNSNNTKVIQGNTQDSFVFVFDKFTLSDKKFLFVEVWEGSGERDLSFKIGGNEILKADKL